MRGEAMIDEERLKRIEEHRRKLDNLDFVHGLWMDTVRSDYDELIATIRELRRQLATAKVDALPRIVCLCGSTRFKAAFDEANYRETMAGRIVLSVGFYMHATENRHGQDVGTTDEQKLRLDELHKRKIDLCDEVLILNVGGYIGNSTRSEIEYAMAHSKPIRYLEPLRADELAKESKP
jgi:hypothetical protein